MQGAQATAQGTGDAVSVAAEGAEEARGRVVAEAVDGEREAAVRAIAGGEALQERGQRLPQSDVLRVAAGPRRLDFQIENQNMM